MPKKGEMTWPGALENIAILAAICFLCWLFRSGWPCVLVLLMNCVVRRDPEPPGAFGD